MPVFLSVSRVSVDTLSSMVDGSWFSLRKAAAECGKSVNTISKNLKELQEKGAYKDAHGWHIPASALVKAGLMPSVTPVSRSVTPVSDGVSENIYVELGTLRGKTSQYEARIAELKTTVADLRQQVHSKDQQISGLQERVNNLEPKLLESSAPAKTDEEVPTEKRSFWKRLFR